jgi:type I restriction enzyme S subunit
MERYSDYKDSGVKWLGEIPRHWEVIKTSRVFSYIGSGTTPKSGSEEYYTQNGVPFLQTGDLNDGYVADTSKRITEKALRDTNLKIYPKGSLIVAMYGATIGKIGILNIDSTVNQACCVLTKSPIIETKFAFYTFLAAKKDLIFQSKGGGQPNISQDTIRNERIPVPPLKEQKAIANYLDAATSKIDETIGQQQKMIDLLNERKQIIINNAVTKGLDPNVPMKDSGVEWIGEIPEHWGVLPIKHFKSHSKNSFVDGPFGSNLKSEHYIENGDVYVIESGMVTTGIFVRKDFKTISYSHFKTIQRSECKAGDIIIAKIGAKFGMAAELPDLGKTCVVSGNSLKLTLNQQLMLNTIFVHNMFLAKCKGGFIGLYQETAQPALSLGDLNNMCFPVPPIEEQKNIEKYLKEKLGIIDTAIEAANKQISLLQERKQIIINDVVTGKVKVL